MEFIKEKSLEIFKALNNLDDLSTSEIIIKKLDGLSNEIYKIELNSRDKELKINSLFFKIFGKVSSILFG